MSVPTPSDVSVPGVQDIGLNGNMGRVQLVCCWSDGITECDWDRIVSKNRSTMVYLDEVIKEARAHRSTHVGSVFVMGAMLPEFARYFVMRGYGDNTLLYCWQEDCRWSDANAMADSVDQVVRKAREHMVTEHGGTGQ